MTYWKAALLGIIQGLTEFLPISSSGHLVLGKAILGIHIQDIVFEIFVHFGTLLAVVTVFREDILLLIKGARQLLSLQPFVKKEKMAAPEDTAGLKLLGLLFIGTLPAATIGFLFKDTFEEAFSHPAFVCVALIFTGFILLASRLAKDTKTEINFFQSLGVGVAQIAAILPGISRSGTTISAGMLFGIQREQSARFSFLLAVPLIFGATLVQSVELFSNFPSGETLLQILVGTILSYVSGLFAIKLLLKIVQKGTFDRFAYYCFAIGILGLLVIYW